MYADPSVYRTGTSYADMDVPLMLRWIWTGLVHSSITFWIPYLAYAKSDTITDGSNGIADGFILSGFVTFLSLIWSMQLVVSLNTLTWTRSGAGIIAFSMIVFYIFALVYASSRTFSDEFYGVAIQAFTRAATWLAVLCSVGTVALWDLTAEAIRLQFRPRAIDIRREQVAGWSYREGVGGGSKNLAAPSQLGHGLAPFKQSPFSSTPNILGGSTGDNAGAAAPGVAGKVEFGAGKPPVNVWT